MIYIPIILIIITICIEIYIRYYDDISKKDISPWSKIIYDKNKNKKIRNNTYIINLNIEDKIKIKNIIDEIHYWKEYINNLDYNSLNNTIIIHSTKEEEALSITNLLLSSLNNEIKLDEIISADLIKISTKKALSHDLVKIKLRVLIKEGIIKLECIENMENSIYMNGNRHFDTSKYIDEPNELNKLNELPIIINPSDTDIPINTHVPIETFSEESITLSNPIQNEVPEHVLHNNTPFTPAIIFEKPSIMPYGGIEYANISF